MIDEQLLSGKRPYDNADEYKELLDLARWALYAKAILTRYMEHTIGFAAMKDCLTAFPKEEE